MNEAHERTAFEHWATDSGEWPHAALRGPSGSYRLMNTEIKWQAWQARAELRHDETLRTVAAQVLRDMQAQDLLPEWQTLLQEALLPPNVGAKR